MNKSQRIAVQGSEISEDSSSGIGEQTTRHIATKSADVARTFIRVGGTVVIFYLIYLTLTAFAGKESSANLKFVAKVITSLRLDQIIAYLTGIAGLVYGFAERALRRGYIEKFSGRIEKLETRIDPGRSSSDLPATGQTRLGD